MAGLLRKGSKRAFSWLYKRLEGSGKMAELLRKAQNRQFPGFTKESEGEWKGSFCFIQSADTQFGMIEDWQNNVQGVWDKEIQLTKQAIAAANKMQPRPKFFIVCGDLVHAFLGEKYREEQERDYKATFCDLDPDIPLVCVCGNHDVGNKPTRESMQHYVNQFGDDYFTFWVGGVKFLVLNSQYYEDPSEVMSLKEEQDKWLDHQLEDTKKSGCKHLVIFQHIPWFLNTPEEEDEYFNIDKTVRLPMLNKLRDAGVRYIFCGHYHRNAGGFYGELEEVVTSALGCPLGQQKSGLRVVCVAEDRITHQYYSADEIPQQVDI